MGNQKLRAALFFPRRIVGLILAFLVMTIFIFSFMAENPSDLADRLSQHLSPEQVEDLMQRYGLDQPLWKQYLQWMKGVLRGDFGHSFVLTNLPVRQMIAARLSSTLRLLCLSILVGIALFALIILIGVRMLDLRYKAPILGMVFQRLWQMGVTLGAATPVFILGIFLLHVFAFKLRWFPASRWISVGSERAFDLKYAILAVLTLSILPACLVARSVLGEVTHYWAANTRNRNALLLHAALSFFRHGLIQFIGMLGGTLFVESLFGLPGVGRLFTESIHERDYPVILGLLIYSLVWTLILKALADLVQGIDAFVLLRLKTIEPGEAAPTPAETPSYAKVLGFVWIVFCLLLVIIPSFQGIGGLLTGGDRIVEQNLMDNLLPPGSESADGFIYAWGTDAFGRDIRSRALYALGLDLGSSLAIAVIVLALALPGGLLAGYLAKVGTIWADLLDDLVMFPVEVLTSVPGLTLLIFILFIGGPGLWNLWVWLALAFLLPRGVRMVRDWWLAISPEKALWLRLAGIVLGVLTLSTGLAVVTQPVAGFLGLGAIPPQPDLGAMLSEGMIAIRTAPHAFLRPAQTLLFAAFGWFLLADTLLGKFGIYKREAWLELNR